MTIRAAILAALKRKKLSQHALAARSGVDASTISRYVRGERGITDSTADRLMGVLGVKIERNGHAP